MNKVPQQNKTVEKTKCVLILDILSVVCGLLLSLQAAVDRSTLLLLVAGTWYCANGTVPYSTCVRVDEKIETGLTDRLF
jgi:hypothetical protein